MKTLFLVMVTTTGLFAGWEDVRGLTAGQRVEVSVRKAEAARGAFVSANETGVVVREKGGERSIARGEIRKVRVGDPSRRIRNGLISTAIGAGVGFAIGCAVCPHFANEGAGGKFTGPGVALGAGIGVAAGFISSPPRTIYRVK